MIRSPAILHTARLTTPLGDFSAHFSEAGLVRLEFPSTGKHPFVSPGIELPVPYRDWAKQTSAALCAALAGKRFTQSLPPLNLAGETPFRRRVWNELQRIPRSETRSYGEIAENLGKRRAARAVGGACGANPVPILIPCHRVLAARGGLGGFSGGLAWKQRLLSLEGVLLT